MQVICQSANQFTPSVVSDSLRPHGIQHARLPVHNQLLQPTQTHVHNVSDAIHHLILCRPLLLLPSVFPSIRSFPMSQFFASGGQSIGVSASTSVLPMNIQDWSPLGWTGWISSMILLKRGTENYVALHGFKSACCHKEKSVMEIYLLSCLQCLE